MGTHDSPDGQLWSFPRVIGISGIRLISRRSLLTPPLLHCYCYYYCYYNCHYDLQWTVAVCVCETTLQASPSSTQVQSAARALKQANTRETRVQLYYTFTPLATSGSLVSINPAAHTRAVQRPIRYADTSDIADSWANQFTHWSWSVFSVCRRHVILY